MKLLFLLYTNQIFISERKFFMFDVRYFIGLFSHLLHASLDCCFYIKTACQGTQIAVMSFQFTPLVNLRQTSLNIKTCQARDKLRTWDDVDTDNHTTKYRLLVVAQYQCYFM
jgi:hypothetical protein